MFGQNPQNLTKNFQILTALHTAKLYGNGKTATAKYTLTPQKSHTKNTPQKAHTPTPKQPQHKAVNPLLKNTTNFLLNKKFKQFPKYFFATSFRRAVAVIFSFT